MADTTCHGRDHRSSPVVSPAMAIPLDARERAELCALFTELGPAAPTLCGDWATADLAAHLVVRERHPLSAPGILVKALGRVTERAMADVEALGYDEVVELVRTGPPLVPWGLPVLREVLNLNEYFVHHEDVRRANGRTARTDRPDLDAAAVSLVRRMAPLMLYRGGVEVELITDAGTTLARRGIAPPKVIGRPSELLLWLNGRGGVAEVAFEGDEAAVSALWGARLGI